MSQKFFVVDAFTAVPFKGNPAAICLLDAFPADAQMQAMAFEMNLSETAFLVKLRDKHYHLRWFTPAVEVNLCGHATLAATHVLHTCGQLAEGETVTYQTLSGELKARITKSGIELDFPTLASMPTRAHEALDALETIFTACEKSRDNYLVEVADYATLLACTPAFKQLKGLDAQGVIVTTAKNLPKGFDFASRYFAADVGIDEDPVTGSAHCVLAPYWAAKLGKQSFHALQASAREGILEVTLQGDRVIIAGQAVITIEGQFNHFYSARKEKAA
jgi:PhzF family phenazine biosynthesis protein